MKVFVNLVIIAGVLASLTSCQMSEDRSAAMGRAIGGAGGAVGAVALSRNSNASTGQTIMNGLGGLVAGAAVGDKVGREGSSLDGMKRTELPDQ